MVQFLNGGAFQEGVDDHVHRKVIDDDSLHDLHQQFRPFRLRGDLSLLIIN